MRDYKVGRSWHDQDQPVPVVPASEKNLYTEFVEREWEEIRKTYSKKTDPLHVAAVSAVGVESFLSFGLLLSISDSCLPGMGTLRTTSTARGISDRLGVASAMMM